MQGKRNKIFPIFLLLNIDIAFATNNDTKIKPDLWVKRGRAFGCEERFLAVNYQNEKPVKGACVPIGYDANQSPNNDSATNVYLSFNHQKFLSVDEADKTFTVDVKASAIWEDRRIKTKLKSRDSYIKLVADKDLPKVWLPISVEENLKELTPHYDPILYTELRFFRDNRISTDATVLNFTVEYRAIIYCDFDFQPFPFDIQKCHYHTRARDPDEIQLWLYDGTDDSLHSNTSYNEAGFHATINFVNNTNNVGFDIELKRLMLPYVLQYYLPCSAVVMVSFISFIVPLSAIPGRIGLMVTQFLTLTNIFIHQIVSTKSLPKSTSKNILRLYVNRNITN